MCLLMYTLDFCWIDNKRGLVHLCINQNVKINLGTTGPTRTFIFPIILAVPDPWLDQNYKKVDIL